MEGKLRNRSRLRAAVYPLMAFAGVFLAVGAWGQQATLVGDAHVSSAQPAVNAGSLSNLNVGGGYTALVQFDVGVLPAGTTAGQITRATLRVYCNRADVPGAVAVQTVGGAWTELSVTYETIPTMGPMLQTTQVGGAGQFVTFDVTSTVQGWVSAPTTNFGLALTAGTGAQVQFDSKENDQTSHAPELAIALAAGGTGTVGATGAAGAQGPQGVPGPVGAAGFNGVNGAIGATGAQGPVGPAGSGAGGMAYRGVYNSGANYAAGDVVGWAGSSWVSLAGANVGNMPGLTAGTWGLVASAGAVGTAGPAGLTGAMGPQGPMGAGVQGATGAVGAVGATGAAGLPGLAYQGGYDPTVNYVVGNVVAFQGSSWVSLVGFNVGQTPGSAAGYWGILTSQGPVGATGIMGAAGPVGGTGALGPVGPPGQQGQVGAQGIAGQGGGQGIPGTTGATGLVGPMGPQGSAGPVGLSFVGGYDAAVNYAVGDGVMWQGEGWVSLVAGNLGHTPSGSPGAWAMFAASGATGAAGVSGQTGATGLNGPTGAVGQAGAAGATGPAGAAGSPGLVYRGVYGSATNYALGDVAVWNGASWVSLSDANTGQTPGTNPASWGVLTTMGPQGPVGPMGAVGGMGPQGVAGLPGPQGSVGGAGPMGIQGPLGAQGLVGATGSVGSTGPQGLQGIVGAGGTQGITGPMGAPGLQGPMGAQGTTGVMGPAGVDGINGLNGTPGMVWQGAWSAGVNYGVDDAVSYSGTSYLSRTVGNVGQRPDVSTASWAVLAQAGTAGASGVAGAAGTTGAAGTAGAQGPMGATGATGLTGMAGVNFRGVWSSAMFYAVNDGVTFAGSTYLALAAGSKIQPDVNPQGWAVLAQAGGVGPTGAQGVAAAMTVGTVTTLAAGSAATVSNSGTAGAAVLNFGIPQGAAGTGGGVAASSGNFAAMYHPVSYNTTYYAVNSPNASATEIGGAALAWIPLGCTATRLDVYSQQMGAITVTLRAGVAGGLVDTALTCSPSTNGSCTVMGAVAIGAGEFMDLRIDLASGVTAGVWTALQCQ